ncbi:MAG: hypothetical protein ACLFUF_07310 [Opitutales bacterium]
MSLLLEISLLGSLLALFVLALRGIGGKWLPPGLYRIRSRKCDLRRIWTGLLVQTDALVRRLRIF